MTHAHPSLTASEAFSLPESVRCGINAVDGNAASGHACTPTFLREQAGKIFANGAVFISPIQPGSHDLVGDLRWPSANQIFWFTAYGDAERDAHLLCFDETRVANGSKIIFQHNGDVVGHLSSIDAAQLDDPDDYRIAWQLWQQVAPLRAPFIERCWCALVSPPPE